MKKMKGFYIELDIGFDYMVNFIGTKALCEQLEASGLEKSTQHLDKIYVVPKKYNKYIDDVAVARMVLLRCKKQFGKLYMSTKALEAVFEDVNFHICDRIVSSEFKKRSMKSKKPINLCDFFRLKELPKGFL
jgi:hypothetical protein